MPGAAPYVPFKTFLTAVEGFERGLPRQLDRSLWPSYSGAIQGQLLGAFRFLGLIDDANCPTQEMKELAAGRERRRAILRGLLERRYAALVALDLARCSPRQLDDAVREFGLTGATHKKAMSFFLQAATYAGLPLSPLLKGKTRKTPAAPRRSEPAPKPPVAETPAAMSKSVRLKSGGAITVTASVDLFGLDAADRAFVFSLIDKLKEYESTA